MRAHYYILIVITAGTIKKIIMLIAAVVAGFSENIFGFKFVFMRSLILFFCLSLSLAEVMAQENLPRNSFYIEAGGAGTFGSLSYERQLTEYHGFGIRAGVGFLADDGSYLSLPIGINYLIPLEQKNQFIDLGLNVTPLIKLTPLEVGDLDQKVFVIPALGYRFHTRKQFFFRISLSLAATRNHSTPWAGIAFGKNF